MDDSSSDRSPLGVLAEEFVDRYRAGQRPSLTEYAERAPELADEIRSLFPTLVEMEQLKPVTGDHTSQYQATMPDLDRLGEFRILRRVGVGGMGVVYEAVQESLGRHVALKVLPSDALADPKRLERFRREAKSAAKLHHTNIVPVFGTGEADGRHYYAMQFITGHPLDAVIDEVQRMRGQGPARGEVSQVAQGLVSGTFTEVAQPPDVPASSLTSGSLSDGRHYWSTVARIGEQVASALAYAHGQGVLHRDIKPANLLLDLHGTVWVADFGLAKAHDSDGLTHVGDIVGTLRYMAPERFDGGGDQRADVYALGLTLYELLTLKPAFNADNRAKLVEQVVTASPPNPRGVNPAIPRDLETIVLKAIARDPAMRYQTASELAEDLRRYQEDRPITARRASRFEQARRWCRRNPAVAGLLAGLFLVFAAGAGVSAIFAVRAERNEAAARRNAEDAQASLEKAERSSQQADRSADEARENARQAAAREKEATDGREKLRAEQDHSRRLIYAGLMHQASLALSEERITRVRQLLEEAKPKPGESDLRGWEWHYLSREVQPPPVKELVLARPHPGGVHTGHAEVTIAAGGRYLVHNREEADGEWFEVWDLTTFQRAGRVPGTGTIPVVRPPTAQAGASSVVMSPDGKYLAALWYKSKPLKGGPEWRLRIWEVATGTEVAGPAAPVRLDSGRLGIGTDAREVVWVERATPSTTPRLDGPLDIVHWTRETGKIERKRIEPARGRLWVVADPAALSALVLPSADGGVPGGMGILSKFESWDLSGETPKRRESLDPQAPGRELKYAVSGLTGGRGTFAIVSPKDLAVFDFSDSSLIWRAALPAEMRPSASFVGVSADSRRAVFDDMECTWVFERTGDGSTGRHWAARHDGMSGVIARGVTADGTSLITACTGSVSIPNKIFVRATDIARDSHALTPFPRAIIRLEGTGPQVPKTFAPGVQGAGPAPNGGYIVRDLAGREFGHIPDLERDWTQSADALCDDRRLLVRSTQPGGRKPDDSKGPFWQLFALNGPGDMPRLAEGTGILLGAVSGRPQMYTRSPNQAQQFPILFGAQSRDFFYVMDRVWGMGGAGDFRYVLVVHDSETGATLGRADYTIRANESLLAVRIVPGSGRILVATHTSGNAKQPAPVTLRLHDGATGKELWKAVGGQNQNSWHPVFSPDGQRAYCVACLDSGRIEAVVVRLADGTVERTFVVLDGNPLPAPKGPQQKRPAPKVAPKAQVGGVAPDGRLVILAGDEVQLWDCGTGTLSQRFAGNTYSPGLRTEEQVTFGQMPPVPLWKPEIVRFSTDGRRMFVAGSRLHVWDLTTGRELMTLSPEGVTPPRYAGRGFYGVTGDKIVVGFQKGVREFDGTPEKP